MIPIDLAGHIAYAWIAFGMYLLAKQKKGGWIFQFCGNLGWAIIGFKVLGLSSIWFWCPVFMIINAIGYIKWRKEKG